MSSLQVGVSDLVNLRYINLSYSNLMGNTPSTISHLSKLVSLDLITNDMELNPFTWKKPILNATNLRELYLDSVNMSSIRENSLSMINNLSSSLVSLSLSYTGMQGNLSSDILSLPNLQKLNLFDNYDLSGQLPKFNWSTPLRYLDLSYITFSGEIPYSIGHLKSLTHLNLRACNFNGMVPPSLWNLTQLTFLNLVANNFEGKISSSLSKLTKLTFLNLGASSFPCLSNLSLSITSLFLTSRFLFSLLRYVPRMNMMLMVTMNTFADDIVIVTVDIRGIWMIKFLILDQISAVLEKQHYCPRNRYNL
ncbi:receptor-like protein 7 [Vicia villosa]|uniref:receptor-like protein 7 n=1 Tax=Vicia villosa TaxID=3911 RepID=UPI00273ABAC5|nr:receptor-like protein 7 [Vicia villosa]